MTHPDYIKSGEASEICGATQDTFNRWVTEGHVPVAITLKGGHRLFERSAIQEFASTLVMRPALPKKAHA